MRNCSLWSNVVFEKEVILTKIFESETDFRPEVFFRHLRAYTFVHQGCFLNLFSCNFDDQLSPTFHRFNILCICGIHQVRKLVFGSPKRSSAFKLTDVQPSRRPDGSHVDYNSLPWRSSFQLSRLPLVVEPSPCLSGCLPCFYWLQGFLRPCLTQALLACQQHSYLFFNLNLHVVRYKGGA